MPEAEGVTRHPPVSENTALGGGSSFQPQAEPWKGASTVKAVALGNKKVQSKVGWGVWGGGAVSVHFRHPARPPVIW